MGMGVAFGGYNRDGWQDVYTSNLYENSLLQNSPQGYFYDVTDSAGVSDIPGSMAWGTFFFDADNNGWLDFFNNNQSGFGNVPNSLFHNLSDGTFEDLSESSGLQSYNNGIGCAYGDLDNDGDLDIIAAGHSYSDGSTLLYRNDSQGGNWVQFSLRSEEGDPFSIGAKVTLYSQSGSNLGGEGNGGVILKEAHLGRDSLVAATMILHRMAMTDKPISTIYDNLPQFSIVKDRVELDGIDKEAVFNKARSIFSDANINEVDGVKFTWTDRWIHLRLSNTEPIMRIYAEGPTKADAQELVNQIRFSL